MQKALLTRLKSFLVVPGILSCLIAGDVMAGDTQVVPPPAQPAVHAPVPLAGWSAQELYIDDIKGVVQVRRAGRDNYQTLTSRTRIHKDDTIRTEGLCTLHLENNTSVTLTPGTEIVISEASVERARAARQTQLELKAGKLRAKIGKLTEGSRFDIRTPTAIAAVRGTDLYLMTGMAAGQAFSELYVDESNGGVLFENLFSGEQFLVPQFGASTSGGDGSILEPRLLTPEEQAVFKKNWEDQIATEVAKKGEVEEESTGGEDGGEEGGEEGGDTNDADADRRSEQNISGSALKDLLAQLTGQYFQNLATITSSILDLQALKNATPDGFPDPAADLNALRRLADGPFGGPREEETFSLLSSEGPSFPAEWSYESVSYSREDSPYEDEPTSNEGDLGIVSDLRNEVLDAFENDPVFEQLDGFETSIDETLEKLLDLLLDATLNLTNGSFAAEALELVADFDGLTDGILEAYLDAVEQARAELEILRETERESIRREVGRLTEELRFQRTDAEIEQASDAKTGKVFTDVHGNRVRVDQYIFQDDPNSVRVMSLTLRTDGPLAGVSAFIFGADFNKAIEGPLRDLPWNDYLNVVTRQELLDGTGLEGGYGTGYREYVVHEGHGSSESAPDLYPHHFFVRFSNPAGEEGETDSIRFDEYYTNPYSIEFTGEESGDEGGYNEPESQTLWIQGKWLSTLFVRTRDGENNVFAFRNFVPANDELTGAQSCDFASMQEDFFNSDTDLYDIVTGEAPDETPAFVHHENLGGRRGYDLMGLFVPIDNQGNIIDAPGFEIQGLRDLVSPNPLVNGGNYNLEVMWFYGRDTGEGMEEIFRIDTIITPEIFQPYGTSNTSELFPATLADVCDDCYDE